MNFVIHNTRDGHAAGARALNRYRCRSLCGTPPVRACEFGRRWGLNYEHYTRLDYNSILQLPCAPSDQECPALHLSPIQLRPFNAGMRDRACLHRAIRACQLVSNQTEAPRALMEIDRRCVSCASFSVSRGASRGLGCLFGDV